MLITHALFGDAKNPPTGRLSNKTLYQVLPPSVVRRTYKSLSAHPFEESIICNDLRFDGEIGGPRVGVGVGEMGVNVGEIGVTVGVIMGGAVNHAKVDITCANTADSAALSKSGGGGKAPFKECKTKSMLMQALFLRVE